MKLAYFDDGKLGKVDGDFVVDLTSGLGESIMALSPDERMNGLIAAFDHHAAFVERAEEPRVPLSSIRLGPPLPRPGKMLVAFDNYREGVDGPDQAIALGLKSPSSVIATGDTVVLPPHEASGFYAQAELAIVVSKRAKAIPVEAAMDHIFGYTCALNVIARGLGFTSGIACDSFDTFGPLGPWIVTRDDLERPEALLVRSWQADEPRQHYSTSDMAHAPHELLSWASHRATLEPGDVIYCGANHHGLGPLQGGEPVSMEIEGVGRLTADVRDSFGRRWVSGPDDELAEAFRRARANGQSVPLSAAFAMPLGASARSGEDGPQRVIQK